MKPVKSKQPPQPETPKREIWTFEPTGDAKKTVAQAIKRIAGNKATKAQTWGLRTRIILKAIELLGASHAKAD